MNRIVKMLFGLLMAVAIGSQYDSITGEYLTQSYATLQIAALVMLGYAIYQAIILILEKDVG